MKVIITSKNFNASDHLKETIEKKFEKLGKYFSNDMVANVMITAEKNRNKMEATINARGTIFRAEETANEAYDAIERVVDKLSSQMSRFKTKLQRKHKDQKEMLFAAIPDYEQDEPEEFIVVKKKKIELIPMTVDEAIVQMELLGHKFFVFVNLETDSVTVAYKRNNQDYGLIETTY